MKHQDLEYTKLANIVLTLVPDLKKSMKEEAHWWGKDQPPQHVLFGDIILPFMIQAIKNHEDVERFRPLFEMFDMMATHPDMKVRSLVEATICPSICSDEVALQRTHRLMGPAVKRVCDGLIR